MARETIYIGFLRSATSRTWVQAPIRSRQVYLGAEFAALRNHRAAGNTEFTLAHGILDVFEKSSFMNNAQLHSRAINEQHNEKETT